MSKLEKFSKEEVLELIEKFSARAKFTLEQDKNHGPTGVVFSEEMGICLVPLHLIMNDVERLFEAGRDQEAYALKSSMWATLHGIIKESHAFGFIFIMEMWVSVRAKPRVVGGDSPGMGRMDYEGAVTARSDPERKEGLSVTYEFKLPDGSKYEGMRSWLFDRVGQRIIFGKQEENHKSEGVLTNLIQ